MQEDLRLVRAPAALGAAVAAAACAARSRLQRPQRQEEMQDQDEEMQDEKSIDQVREEMQEGQKEAEVPEDLLRARLPRLNRPLTSAPSSRVAEAESMATALSRSPLYVRGGRLHAFEKLFALTLYIDRKIWPERCRFGAALGRFKGQGFGCGNCLGGKAGCGDGPPKAGKV